MRIALYHHLPPGGALRSVIEVVRRLPTSVVCDVYTLDSSAWWPFGVSRQETELAVPVHRHPLRMPRWADIGRGRVRHEALLGAVHRAEREVAALVNQGGYDGVLVHPCWVSQTPRILEHLRGPTAYYMHEPRRRTFEALYRDQGELQPLRSRIVTSARERRLVRADRAAAKRPDALLCNSYYSRESIKRAYGLEASVSYLGVDEAVFGPAGPSDREDAVIAVGGMEPFKRHDFVVRAIGELPRERRPRVHLVFERSDAAYRAVVQRLAVDLGVDVIEHHGIDDATLVHLYRTARATILAADLEPFGLTMLESLACGTPLVAVREGGYREVVEDGVNGLLTDRSPAALARAIDQVASPDAVLDPAALRSSVLPFWTWDLAAQRQMDLMAAVISGSRR